MNNLKLRALPYAGVLVAIASRRRVHGRSLIAVA